MFTDASIRLPDLFRRMFLPSLALPAKPPAPVNSAVSTFYSPFFFFSYSTFVFASLSPLVAPFHPFQLFPAWNGSMCLLPSCQNLERP